METRANLLCPTCFCLRQQCARAGATMEYWQGAFAQTMPEERFKRRGWDTESGQGYLSPENSVVVLSEDCIIDPNGKAKKLTCSCNRELAPKRKCRSCKCAKRGKPCVAITCGCKGFCGRAAGGPVTLAPEAPPPDSQSTTTQDISAGAQEGEMRINMKWPELRISR